MKTLHHSMPFALLALGISAASVAQTQKLNLDLERVTVSGLSSGGYMANQFHLAFSDWVSGAGIIAAGPYYCARNDITVALGQCVDKVTAPIEVEALSAQARQWASEHKIAALDNLADSKVWLFHGSADNRVNKAVSQALYAQYQSWVNAENLVYVNDKPFAHLFPTLTNGGNCAESESPFIGQCDYDAAGQMLNHLYDDLATPDGALSGKVIEFSQTQIAGSKASTMAETGYAYVPQRCQQGDSCRVHISFHGCNQFAEAIGTQYAENTGLNRWADDNQMVVVYPQTKKSMFMPLNPQGCWDWWGYTGEDYATANGQQLQAVKAIVEGLNHKEDTQ
ncbi:polyhydroxybutyrate depolymerase [Alteromonas aestuariivivens]|uniref:Polyhydroxybutyrate depolymerase n=1 Tax=Alteromonas aestuariivivens TaxID=1938339 RepID=A0A3D8M4K9_9ALTE|nr:PHB depolymerase family esterase [Alteromonas aestuariivivens]RDV24596.1 polyhydroxybutyrate depolymerase [Alteromonas aestuariivivens]